MIIEIDFRSVFSELIRRSVPNNLMGMSRREIDFDFDEVSFIVVIVSFFLD